MAALAWLRVLKSQSHLVTVTSGQAHQENVMTLILS